MESYFIICRLLTTSFETKHIEKFLSTQLQEKTITSEAVFCTIGNYLIPFFKSLDNASSLEEDIKKLQAFASRFVDNQCTDSKMAFVNFGDTKVINKNSYHPLFATLKIDGVEKNLEKLVCNIKVDDKNASDKIEKTSQSAMRNVCT